MGDAASVRVKVLLFAGARELSGCNEGELLACTTETYDSLLAKVVQHFSLFKIQNSLILAINEEYPSSDKSLVLRDGDLIAVIPPLSGGKISEVMDTIRLTQDKLSVDEATQVVTAPTCGAISIFVGTTRNNFEEKKVLQLEYEAYDSMAEKVMKELCAEIRTKWTVENIAIFHRLGVVPVCEASVIIAVSSEHRGEALAATQHAIHALKAAVPIWKKEVYDEASGSEPKWKENKESIPAAAMEVEIGSPDEQPANIEEVDSVLPNLVQIKATPEEVRRRIDAFILRKREDVNRINIRDFCTRSWQQAEEKDEDGEILESCARVNAVLVPRKDSKSHLRVRRVLNTWGPQTRGIDPGSMPQCKVEDIIKPTMTQIPPAVAERLANIESHLSLRGRDGPVPPDVYARLKQAEEKILYLESVSPEYFNASVLSASVSAPDSRPTKRKKVYSAAELRNKLLQFETN